MEYLTGVLMLKTTVVFAVLLAVSFVGAGVNVDVAQDVAPEATWMDPVLLPGAPLDGPYPMGLAYLTHGNDWEVDQPPAGQSALERANWVMNERDAKGKTPQAWIDWATGLHGVAAVELPDVTLEASMARLYAAVDIPLTADDILSIQTQSDALPEDIEKPFAGLLDIVAAAYEEQAIVAADIIQRFPSFDPHVSLMTQEQRDETSARAENILGAITAFRLATEEAMRALPSISTSGNDPALFEDQNGLVFLGGLGDGTYTRDGVLQDPILLIEPSGNDVYLNSAGGACPDAANLLTKCNKLALSVVSDFDGDDQYLYDGESSVIQGSGAMGGLGILADAAGDDVYQVKMTRGTFGPYIAVQYYFDGGGQGYGYFGEGYLLDAGGDDVYKFEIESVGNRNMWAFNQGFGSGGGLGVAVDGGGVDLWDNQVTNTADGPWNGFQGIFSQGTGFYGGVGIIADIGGEDDVYYNVLESRTADYYAQGFGAFGGVGIMYEDGGDEDYTAISHGRNPWINPLLNCAYGTGSYAGTGIIVDVSGNDRYYGETINDRRGATIDNEGAGHPAPAYGLFMDLGGDDEHLMYATAPPGQHTHVGGRGLVEFDNLVGTYVDIGGTDVYVGPGSDGGTWLLGADINTV